MTSISAPAGPGGLRNEATILAAGSGIAMASGVLLLAVLVRALPNAQVGQLILLAAYPALIHQFANLQSWQGYSREGLALLADDDKAGFASLTQAFFRLDAICSVAAFLLALLLVSATVNLLDWPEHWRVWLYAFSALLLTNYTSFSLAVMRCFKSYRTQAVCTVLLPLSQLAVALVLWRHNADIESYLIAWLALTVISHVSHLLAAVVILARRRITRWFAARPRNSGGSLGFTAWVNLATSLDSIVKQFDVILVSALISIEVVPVYRLIKQCGAVFYRFADGLAQASFPRLVTLTLSRKLPAALSLFRRSALWLLIGSTCAATAIAGTSSYWLGRVFTPEFAAFAPQLSTYLAIVVVAVTFTALHQLIYALGYVRRPAALTALAVVAFLACAIWLAPSHGLWAFMIGFAIYHGIAITGKLLLLNQHRALTVAGQA